MVAFLFLFLIGYYVIREDAVMEKIIRYRKWFFPLFLLADAANVYMFIWIKDANGTWNYILTYISCWFGILTVLGYAHDKFCIHNRITQYFTANSFLFYIFHFGWLTVIQFYLSQTEISIVGMYIISVVGTYLLTFLTCSLVRKIPIVRMLFGVYRKRIK